MRKGVKLLASEDFAQQVWWSFEFTDLFGLDWLKLVHDDFLDHKAEFLSLFRGFLFEDAACGENVAENAKVGHEDMFIEIVTVGIELS